MCLWTPNGIRDVHLTCSLFWTVLLKRKKNLQPVNKTTITLRDVSEHESFVIVLVLWV